MTPRCRRPNALARYLAFALSAAATLLLSASANAQTVWGAPTQIIENFVVPPGMPLGTFGGLKQPLGVTADSRHNIIVADTRGGRVVVLDPTGQTLVAVFECDPNNPTNCLVTPTSVAVDTNDTVYVVDYDQHTVYVLGSAASAVNGSLLFLDRLGSPGGYDFGADIGTLAELDYPWVVDVDRNPLNDSRRRTNRLYILDSGNGRIVGWDCNTTPPIAAHPCGTQATVSLLSYAPEFDVCPCPAPPYQYVYGSQGFGIDQLTGDIALADSFLQVVNFYKWPFNSANNPALPPGDPWGYQSTLGTPGLVEVGLGGLQNPTDVKFDATHNLWVVDKDNHRIQVFKQVPPPGGVGAITIDPTPIFQPLTGAPNFVFHYLKTVYLDFSALSGPRALVADQDNVDGDVSRIQVWSPVGLTVSDTLSTLTPTAGTPFDASITVTNSGNAALDLSAVTPALTVTSGNRATVDLSSAPDAIQPVPAGSVLGSLAPGASQAFTVQLNPKKQGSTTVSFTAAGLNLFSGIAVQSAPFVSSVISVQAVQAPALSVASVTPSATAVNRSSSFTVVVTVANTGNTTLTNPALAISTSNSFITCDAARTSPAGTSIPSGATGNTYTFAAFSCSAGATVGTTTLIVSATASSGSTAIAAPANSEAQVAVSPDTVPPVTTLTITRADGISAVPTVNGYYVEFPKLTFRATDNAGGTGVKQICYTFAQPATYPFFPANCHNSNSTNLTFSYSASVQIDSRYSVTYYAVDNGGLPDALKTVSFAIDTTGPTAVFTQLTPVPNVNGWNATPVTWTISPSDNISQVQSMTFAGASLTLTNPKITIDAQGSGLVATVIVTDYAGHSAPVSSPPVNIDRLPPTLTPVATGPLVFFPPASASLLNGLGDPAPATPLPSGVTFFAEGEYQVSGITFQNGGFQSSGVDPNAADGLPPAAGVPASGDKHTWKICDLAGNCTTAYFQPEVVNRFDPVALGDALYVRYGTSGNLPTPLSPITQHGSGRRHWGDRGGFWSGHDDHRWDDDDHDADDCDVQTFKVLDVSGNGIVMVEHIQRSRGGEVHVGVISYAYITGCPVNCLTTPAIVPKGTTKNFEWSTDRKTGKLLELEQAFSIGRGESLRVWAKYDARKNTTTIQRAGRNGFKTTLPGLVLLDLATKQGKLVIEYNDVIVATQP